MAKVVIDSSSSLIDRNKLRRFVRSARKFASRLGADVVLHSGHGKQCPAIIDGRVHIHFLGYPPKPLAFLTPTQTQTCMGYVDKAYGFDIPTDRMKLYAYKHIASGEDVGLRIQSKNCSPVPRHIKAFGNNSPMIALSENKNIWILFNIHLRPWNGDTIVFERILEEVCQKADPDEAIERLHNSKHYAAYARRRCLRFYGANSVPVGNKEATEGFRAAALAPILASLSIMQDDIDKKSKDVELVERDLVRFSVDLAVTRKTIHDFASIAPLPEDKAKEYDEILSWPVTESLEVGENTISLITKPLSLFLSKKNEHFPMAQFVIEINPFGLQRYDSGGTKTIDGIKIWEKPGGWRGEWRHPEAFEASKQICFGEFADSIWKLFSEFNVRDIMHLLITFICGDQRTPKTRETGQASAEPYCSPEIAEQAVRENRRKYGEFARRAVIENFERDLKQHQDNMERTIQGRVADYVKQLDDIRQLSLKRGAALEMLDDQVVSCGLKKLLDHARLADLWIGQDCIQAVFVPHMGVKDMAGVMFLEIRIFINALTNAYDVRIEKLNTIERYVYGVGGHEWRQLTSKLGARFRELLACGYLAEAVLFLYGLAKGQVAEVLLCDTESFVSLQKEEAEDGTDQ
jgi:hypothetical protein